MQSVAINNRRIGQLRTLPNGKQQYFKHINKKYHILRKTNSVGFNYEVISKLKDDDELWINIDKLSTKYITVAQAKKHGHIMRFNNFELQLFVPLEKFINYK